MPALLVLTRYHLGDPLFARGLARALKGAGGLVIVHDSGEEGERALEATGAIPEREGGVVRARTAEERSLIERAVRELNRTLVHELNEEHVPALRVLGTDRGLLKGTPDGLVTGRTQWLRDLAAQSAVPVVGSLTATEGGPVEVAAVDAALALNGAFGGDLPLLFLARDTRGGLRRDGAPVERIGPDALENRDVYDVEPVRRAAAAGADVRVVAYGGLASAGAVGGTRIAPGDGPG